MGKWIMDFDNAEINIVRGLPDYIAIRPHISVTGDLIRDKGYKVVVTSVDGVITIDTKKRKVKKETK